MAVKFLTGVDLNNQRGRAFADPTAASDGATKQYVDNLVDGLRWKQPVVAATTANGALATVYENGDVVDGVTLATGDRILLKNQSTGSENGIYTVNATGAPTRASDSNAASEVKAATVLTLEGTVNAGKAFTMTTDGTITIDTTALVFVEFGGGTSYSADGIGIELSGTTFALELDGTSLSKSATGLRIGSAAAGSGLTESGGILAVGAGTGVSVTADAVAIDTAVVVRKFAQNVGALTGGTALTITHNLGTKDITAQLIEIATGAFTYADLIAVTTNTMTITSSTSASADVYRIVIQA